MKNRFKLIACSAVLFVVFLFAYLPASFVLSRVPKPPWVELSGISGSIWSGSVRLVSFNGVVLESVRWELSVLALFTGKASAAVSVGDRTSEFAGRANLTLGRQDVLVENLEAEARAASILPHLPLIIPMTVSGTVILSVDRFEYSSGSCSNMNGELVWDRGTLETPAGIINTGEAKTKLGCRDGGIEGLIIQSSDYFATDAVLVVNMDGSYIFNGSLVPGEAMPGPVQDSLRLLTGAQPGDDLPLNYSGRIEL